ncbi:sulfotransferase [Thalassolituus sp. LLYu03]|uniref:sulfotransferase n=1 Tax=Thalassolituus sp. LLYu03 TaxID=3421656 RepID=UPI003D2E1867
MLIGGVGGSGTRVVASAFQQAGVFIGSHLNKSLDNLNWPGNIPLVLSGELSEQEKCERLRDPFLRFFEHMTREAKEHSPESDVFAVKVPGSFYYLPYLVDAVPNLSYIHVIRHGLDMAYSGNRNQLRNWGSKFNLCDDVAPGNEASQLTYWLDANRYALSLMASLPLQASSIVRFEDFCQNTVEEAAALWKSAGLDLNLPAAFFDSVRLPESSGRYHQHDISVFDADDLAALTDFGYSV